MDNQQSPSLDNSWKSSGFKKTETPSESSSESKPKSTDPLSGVTRVNPVSSALPKTELPVKPQPSLSKKMPPSGKKRWWQRRGVQIGAGVTLFVLLLIAGIGGVVGLQVYSAAQQLKSIADQAQVEGRAVYDSFKAQNLPEAKVHLENVQAKVKEAEVVMARLSWTKALPVARTYYIDGEHGLTAALAGTQAGLKLLAAIEPHADVLGFEGEGTFAGNTEDRVAMVLETLNQIAPQLDSIAGEITIMQENLNEINPENYPEMLRGYPVRQYILQAQSAADAAEVALNEARPALERLPIVAGAEGRRKYLVIFQNDNELRPTGGFMTAYAVVFVENGKITAEKSDDIYELDQKFRSKPAIPEVLGKYLITESRWNLRDMNIDPNFAQSMETFYEYYQNIPGEPGDIDGIIAVDTEMLTKIVDVLGPIDVPGYGTFSTQNLAVCDCPQIIYILSEIIDRPTPYLRENRKGILAPMMQAIIAKTYATPRDKWPQLAQIAWEGVQGRHLQMYFFNEQDQLAAESVNAAGIIPNIPEGNDFLAVIDANLAGAKSNLFIETNGTQKISGVENGRLTKEVELTYRNTHPPSNCNLEAGQLCLNGLLNDWTRWYVPKGTLVEEAIGFKDGYTLDTSNPSFDIIEGFFTVSPLSQTKIRIRYSVPYTETDKYVLTMQKQGGITSIPFEITTPWGASEVVLDRDRTITIQ